MKQLVTKLFAVIFILMLAAGCASTITAPGPELQTEQQTEIATPDDVNSGTVSMHRERPEF